MKKKLLALLCILSLSVAALAGCGSSDAPASGSAAADQASAAEETADPVDVNVMALKGPNSPTTIIISASLLLLMRFLQR